MRPNRFKSLVVYTFVCLLVGGQAVLAQRMPRENVVDVAAKVDGLHVSNLFQSNMVLQRDKPIHIWDGLRREKKSPSAFWMRV